MAARHELALAGALLALLCLPCAVALLVRVEHQLAARRSWRLDATTRELLRRLDLRLRTRPAAALEPATGPGADQVAAELRRLQHLRLHGPATRSETWLAAVNDAYDRWLCHGCHLLGVDQELMRLDGLDRELERARIEEILRDKGF